MNHPAKPDIGSRSAQSSEAGFMLVFVVLMAALVLIALAVAAPIMAKQLQRDKEVESAHRANEYVRAIRLYYRKFKTYPPSIDVLENSNNIRFLRKRYVDPLTGKDDWRIIHVGENKTTVKGFFGQPLGGLNTSGVGSSLGTATGMMSNIGGSSANGSSSSTSPSTTVSGGSALASGFQGATIGGSTTGSSTSATSTSSDSGSGGVGQIMGVGTAKTGTSILNPNQQTTYETWEFIYDPKIELLYQQANILGGPSSVNSTSPSSMTTTSPGATTGAGQASPFGGSSTTTPTAPASTSPQ